MLKQLEHKEEDLTGKTEEIKVLSMMTMKMSQRECSIFQMEPRIALILLKDIAINREIDSPLSAPSLTLAANAEPVSARVAIPTPKPAAAFLMEFMLATHTTREVARAHTAERAWVAKVAFMLQVCIFSGLCETEGFEIRENYS